METDAVEVPVRAKRERKQPQFFKPAEDLGRRRSSGTVEVQDYLSGLQDQGGVHDSSREEVNPGAPPAASEGPVQAPMKAKRGRPRKVVPVAPQEPAAKRVKDSSDGAKPSKMSEPPAPSPTVSSGAAPGQTREQKSPKATGSSPPAEGKGLGEVLPHRPTPKHYTAPGSGSKSGVSNGLKPSPGHAPVSSGKAVSGPVTGPQAQTPAALKAVANASPLKGSCAVDRASTPKASGPKGIAPGPAAAAAALPVEGSGVKPAGAAVNGARTGVRPGAESARAPEALKQRLVQPVAKVSPSVARPSPLVAKAGATAAPRGISGPAARDPRMGAGVQEPREIAQSAAAAPAVATAAAAGVTDLSKAAAVRRASPPGVTDFAKQHAARLVSPQGAAGPSAQAAAVRRTSSPGVTDFSSQRPSTSRFVPGAALAALAELPARENGDAADRDGGGEAQQSQKIVQSYKIDDLLEQLERQLDFLQCSKKSIHDAAATAADLAELDAAPKAVRTITERLLAVEEVQKQIALFYLLDCMMKVPKDCQRPGMSAIVKKFSDLVAIALPAVVLRLSKDSDAASKVEKCLKQWADRAYLPEAVLRPVMGKLSDEVAAREQAFFARHGRGQHTPGSQIYGFRVDVSGKGFVKAELESPYWSASDFLKKKDLQMNGVPLAELALEDFDDEYDPFFSACRAKHMIDGSLRLRFQPPPAPAHIAKGALTPDHLGFDDQALAVASGPPAAPESDFMAEEYRILASMAAHPPSSSAEEDRRMLPPPLYHEPDFNPPDTFNPSETYGEPSPGQSQGRSYVSDPYGNEDDDQPPPPLPSSPGPPLWGLGSASGTGALVEGLSPLYKELLGAAAVAAATRPAPPPPSWQVEGSYAVESYAELDSRPSSQGGSGGASGRFSYLSGTPDADLGGWSNVSEESGAVSRRPAPPPPTSWHADEIYAELDSRPDPGGLSGGASGGFSYPSGTPDLDRGGWSSVAEESGEAFGAGVRRPSWAAAEQPPLPGPPLPTSPPPLPPPEEEAPPLPGSPPPLPPGGSEDEMELEDEEAPPLPGGPPPGPFPTAATQQHFWPQQQQDYSGMAAYAYVGAPGFDGQYGYRPPFPGQGYQGAVPSTQASAYAWQ